MAITNEQLYILLTRVYERQHRLSFDEYAPTSITVQAGTLSSGDYTSLAELDGTYLVIDEADADPGLQLDVVFSPPAGSTVYSVVFIGRYDHDPAHYINVLAWNVVNEVYDDISTTLSGTIQHQNDNDLLYEYKLTSEHIAADGTVSIRFDHFPSLGTNGGVFYLDKVCLCVLGGENRDTQDANLVQIEGNSVTDNSASLYLKEFNLTNSAGNAFYVESADEHAIRIVAPSGKRSISMSRDISTDEQSGYKLMEATKRTYDSFRYGITKYLSVMGMTSIASITSSTFPASPAKIEITAFGPDYQPSEQFFPLGYYEDGVWNPDAGWTEPVVQGRGLHFSVTNTEVAFQIIAVCNFYGGGQQTFTLDFPARYGNCTYGMMANEKVCDASGGIPVTTEAVIDSNVVQVSGDATSATNLMNSTKTIYVGSVTGIATSTSLIDSGLTQSVTNHWYGRIVLFTSGDLKYQATDIVAFDPATDKLTFTELTGAPGLGDAYVIV